MTGRRWRALRNSGGYNGGGAVLMAGNIDKYVERVAFGLGGQRWEAHDWLKDNIDGKY